ncbi:FlgO family outer membrane protein [Chitinimonas sp. BJB300]|uniref:FlgO family outer membrane protein n=1 Tax=Chitinimonas sp. BJB300 TaxID=1559339 RepID=UPI000C105E14|nr:FlgO family outer membrane protein [Chitinimonas sp. BJB300]PHV13286.1 hypothetical protein CSQ89_01200 [Chitinimonas sp. BJB300]TSJ86009.1 hypothetical protein FG002_016720 [Chitinimonas sp. BJB300]
MRVLFAVLMLLSLAGCAGYQHGVKNPMIKASYDAADRLAAMAYPIIKVDQPVIVATFVQIDRLTTTTTFGRLMAEQVASRLLFQKYPIVELKLRGSVFVREGTGELLLSREVKDLSAAHNVQAVIVGTYALAGEKIFLNLKVVRPTDNRVLAAHDLAIEIDETTRALLMSDPS